MERVSRIAHVDGLRAVAVLAVLASHTPTAATSPLRMGAHGVDLFFVISGFCLAYPTLTVLNERGLSSFDVSRYVAHRLTRILPPFYIAILLLVILSIILQRVGFRAPEGLRGPLNVMSILHQMFFWDGNVSYLNRSFWTLAVEFRWYALFPMLLYLWTRSPRAFAVVGVVATFSSLTQMGSLDLYVLPAFMLGIVAADIHVRQWPPARLAPMALVPLLAWGVAAEPPSNLGINFIDPAWQLSAFIFVVSGGLPFFSRVLSFRPLAFIGIASYSIYLIHGPFIDIAKRYGVGFPLLIAVGMIAGILFWALIERPLLRRSTRSRMNDEILGFAPRWLSSIGLPLQIVMQREDWARLRVTPPNVMPAQDQGSVITPGTGL